LLCIQTEAKVIGWERRSLEVINLKAMAGKSGILEEKRRGENHDFGPSRARRDSDPRKRTIGKEMQRRSRRWKKKKGKSREHENHPNSSNKTNRREERSWA